MDVSALAVLLAFLALLRLLYNYARLKSIPGPLLASFSDIWRAYAWNSPGYDRRLAKLHQKYGNIVRLGPNFVSICDCEKIANIYRVRLAEELNQDDQGLLRNTASNTYPEVVWDDLDDRRRGTALQYEGSIDTSLESMVRTIRRHRVLDITVSLRFFAEEFVNRFVVHHYDTQNKDPAGLPTTNYLGRRPKISPILSTAEGLLLKGPVPLLKRERVSCFGVRKRLPPPPTFAADPIVKEIQSPGHLSTCGISTLSVGIHSVINVIVNVLPFLLDHPDIMSRVRAEIDTVFRSRDTSLFPQWTDIRRLSYLEAVLKECIRHLSSGSFVQEALITAGTYDAPGLQLPSGTFVGWHPRTLQFNRSVYGADVDMFLPERWLVADMRQRNLMEQGLLPFSVCIERHPKLQAAWLELEKTIVVILRSFDLQLLHTEETSSSSERFVSSPSTLVQFTPRIP